MRRHLRLHGLAIILPVLLSACGSPTPVRTEKRVDLNRFMGDWYVIANIPTSIARTPEVSDGDYHRFLCLIVKEGYDVSQVRKVPQ